jgi:hypothetical protein
MENFKKIFSSNGYPKALIDICVVNSHLQYKTYSIDSIDRIYNTKDKVHTCSKKNNGLILQKRLLSLKEKIIFSETS